MFRLKSFWLFLFAFPLLVKGDDGYLGTRGGNVFPIHRNQQIRMRKENITITLLRDSCLVKCQFWFTNETNDLIDSVYMGFPDYIENRESRGHPLRNFSCKVGGKATLFNKKKQVSSEVSDSAAAFYGEGDYENWYCWHVCGIKPHETIFIENTYTGDWGGSVYGNAPFDYLIGTAQTWRGTIGQGKVVFDYSQLASLLFVDTTYEADYPLPAGIKRTIYNDSMVFFFTDYYPKWNESLFINMIDYWSAVTADNVTDWPLYSPEVCQSFIYGSFDKERLRSMKNEIYARHGYIFKDPDLKAYLGKQKWYRPDPSFAPDKLNLHEKHVIDCLLKLEKENKPQR